MRNFAIAIVFSLLVPSAFAASKTVTLSVPGMNCSLCPITVKTALKRVNGVTSVSVTYEPKQAVVTFDDSRTNVDALRDATESVGYPSTVKP